MRHSTPIYTTLAGLLMAAAATSQAQTTGLAFEVASIKPTDPNTTGVRVGPTPGGGISFSNVDLRQIVAAAWDIRCGRDCAFHILLAPALAGAKWIDQQHFDIEAKGPASGEAHKPLAELTGGDREAFQARIRLRLQTLLAERFHLLAHEETREMPAYNLVPARNGSKLRPSPVSTAGGTINGSKGEMVANNINLETLARNLTSMLGRPVVDRTALAGSYDFTLRYAPEEMTPGPNRESDDLRPSIFTALQEQLGLKLEPTRTPIQVIVIDLAEPPTAN